MGYYYVNSQTWQRLDPFDAPLFFRLYLTTMPLGLTTQVDENTLFALPFALLVGIGLLAFILMPKLVSASGSWMDWRRAGGLLRRTWDRLGGKDINLI